MSNDHIRETVQLICDLVHLFDVLLICQFLWDLNGSNLALKAFSSRIANVEGFLRLGVELRVKVNAKLVRYI